jgi:ribonuclease Z
MKKLLYSLLFLPVLIALITTCCDEPDSDEPDSGVSNPECTSEVTAFEEIYLEGGPPPELPDGQISEMQGSQMATFRETQSLARESLLNKDIITVTVCGSNSPLPTTPGAQACTAVFVNGQFLLFDAGDGAQRSMGDLNLPMADLSALFITHYHNDHVADVGEVIQRSWMAGRPQQLPVYGGVGLMLLTDGINDFYDADSRVREAHHGQAFLPAECGRPIPHPITLAEGESVVVYERDGVVVTAFDVHHPPVEPALGYTVTYQGKKVVISGDTADTPTLHQHSLNADVLVSDVMNKEAIKAQEAINAANGLYRNAIISRDIREYHIDVNEVGALAQASGVKTLVLTHLIPNLNNERIQQLWYTQPIRSHYSGNLLIAHDGTMVKMRLATPDGHEIVTEHYENGALHSEVSYINGIKDGLALNWYENGDLKSEIHWTMGSGRALNYDRNGALIQPSIHPEYSGKIFELSNARALIITTSVSTLGDGGAATGVFASEMTAPYYEFMGAGMDVDVASIEGGKIPIDPSSFSPAIISKYDERYLKDQVFLNKTANSLKIDDLDFTEYDVVYLAGGWGAAYDLGYSEVLGEKITAAYQAGIPLGAVCHGPLGFLRARDDSGTPLVQGRRMTGVTDKQVSELGIEMTPQHPETELRNAGAIYESITLTSGGDFMANYVVSDGLIVTGQNQNSGAEVAHWLMELIETTQ